MTVSEGAGPNNSSETAGAVFFPELRRVQTDDGSHIEPPLVQSWPQIEKLRWGARVTEVDAGLPPGTFAIHEHEGQFSIGTPGVGRQFESYHQAWRDLVTMGDGVQLARRVLS